eukprot:jgi/Mesen1/2726/ME000168S01781
MTRSPCCEKSGLKKGPWTPEEDEKLVAYINENGEGNWSSVPKKAGLLRCGKSCRLRWANYLRPDLKRGVFTEEEEKLILDLHKAMGNRWAKIALELPGRTDNDIKNYWNTRIKRKLRDAGIDPISHMPLSEVDPDSASKLSEKGSKRGPPPGESSKKLKAAGAKKNSPPKRRRLYLEKGDKDEEDVDYYSMEAGDGESKDVVEQNCDQAVKVGELGVFPRPNGDYETTDDESVGESDDEEQHSEQHSFSSADSMDGMGASAPVSPTSVIRYPQEKNFGHGKSLAMRPELTLIIPDNFGSDIASPVSLLGPFTLKGRVNQVKLEAKADHGANLEDRPSGAVGISTPVLISPNIFSMSEVWTWNNANPYASISSPRSPSPVAKLPLNSPMGDLTSYDKCVAAGPFEEITGRIGNGSLDLKPEAIPEFMMVGVEDILEDACFSPEDVPGPHVAAIKEEVDPTGVWAQSSQPLSSLLPQNSWMDFDLSVMFGGSPRKGAVPESGHMSCALTKSGLSFINPFDVKHGGHFAANTAN